MEKILKQMGYNSIQDMFKELEESYPVEIREVLYKGFIIRVQRETNN